MTVSPRSQADWSHLEGLYPRYLGGDAEAARMLFSELLRVLTGYFRIRVNSQEDAEELPQVTLLKVHFARDRYDSRQRLKTWVFTIASRTLIDHRRGDASESEVIDSGAVLDPESADRDIEALASHLLDPARKTELHRDINQALMKLKPTERSIVYLYGVEGLSMAEVGEALLMTEGAAKLRAHRAYQELRKYLASGTGF